VIATGLYLVHGTEKVLLGDRDVAIGRLPECAVALDGWEVSRRHARIIPTAAGPVLVDRSRFGTFVNGTRVIAPLLLGSGDVIRIGTVELQVASGPPPAAPARPGAASGARLREWWRRYGPSEVGGAVAALAGSLGALGLGSRIPVAAISGTLAEVAWFYLSLAARDLRYEARQQQSAGRVFDRRAATDVLRNLAREFGAADAVDLLVRPICLGLGLATLGRVPGVLVGKLVADGLFYGPILAIWHWRRGRRVPPPDPSRLRQTTGAELPLGRLAELHLRLEAEDAEQPEVPSSNRND